MNNPSIPKRWWQWGVAGLIGLGLVVGAVVDLWGEGQTDSSSSTQPRVTWTPESVIETVGAGQVRTVRVSFVATQPIPKVTVRVTPELTPIVKVESLELVNIATNKPAYLTLTLAPAATVLPQTLEGTIQIRNGTRPSNIVAKPLPVTAHVVWQSVADPSLPFALSVPASFIPSRSTDPTAGRIAFSQSDDSRVRGLPPILVVNVMSLPTGLSLREWIRSSGIPETAVEDVSVGQREYVRWSEFEDDGIGTVTYSTSLSDSHVLNVTTPSRDFGSSDAFLQILSSVRTPSR